MFSGEAQPAVASSCISSLPLSLILDNWKKIDITIKTFLGFVSGHWNLNSFGIFPCSHQLRFLKPEFTGSFLASLNPNLCLLVLVDLVKFSAGW